MYSRNCTPTRAKLLLPRGKKERENTIFSLPLSEEGTGERETSCILIYYINIQGVPVVFLPSATLNFAPPRSELLASTNRAHDRMPRINGLGDSPCPLRAPAPLAALHHDPSKFTSSTQEKEREKYRFFFPCFLRKEQRRERETPYINIYYKIIYINPGCLGRSLSSGHDKALAITSG